MKTFRLRPSASAVWTVCNGSVQMQERYPRDTGPEAEEGTAAHSVWATKLTTGSFPPVGSLVGDTATVPVTQEMIDGARLFIDTVSSWGIPHIHVEEQVSTGVIHPEHGGTPDAWAFNREALKLFVGDYKFGHGFVEVFENTQLMGYAAELLELLELNGIDEQYVTVEFVIVQPRAYHKDGPVRPWTVRASDLRAHFNTLRMAGEAALSTNPKTVAGPHCEHCSARHACETLQRASYNVLSITGQAVPFELDPNALGHELARLEIAEKVLKSRLSGLREQATASIRRGQRVSNYGLEQGFGRETWKEGMESSVIGLGAIMGINLAKPPAAITPAQARNLGVDASVISAYSHKPVGELKLVRNDTTSTRKIFGA